MQRLQQGIGSMLASRPLGSGGQYGQMAGSSQPNPPSLEEVLSERGFTVPERPSGYMTRDMAFFGKDPVTGRTRQGSSSMGDYYRAMDEMYAQNPEALEIAKQYTADPTQFGGEKPTDRAAVLGGQLNQVFGNKPQQFQGPSLDPAQQQQELAALSSAQASAAGMPPPQPVQQFQPIQRPSMQSLQQPMGRQQPQFTQQDMRGMMQMMMQMFQQMMQSGIGQQPFNSGVFNNAPSNFYPQYPSMTRQEFAAPPQLSRMRQATRFGASPFGNY